MRLEEVVDLLPPEGGEELLVMELAQGGERTVDGIADGVRVVLGHPKTREAMRAEAALVITFKLSTTPGTTSCSSPE